MKIKLEAEGEREHFGLLLTALGSLVVDSLMDRLPLSASLEGDLVNDVSVTIARKPPATGK